MFRTCAAAFLYFYLASVAAAQAQPAASAATNQQERAKPPAKKPAPNAKSAAIPTTPSVGPCKYGVIIAVGDVFAVQKIGLTVFGNEYAEVPVSSWGLEDLIFARMRAAAGAIPLRRIGFAKGTFDPYYHPQPSLFRNQNQELTDLVRQIVGKSSCERYYVFTRVKGQVQGTNQFIEGIGVLNRGVGLLNSTSLFANLSLKVFDGRTFEIRRAPVDLDAVMKRMLASLAGDPSLHKIDDSAYPASPADAATSSVLREGTRNLLTERLDKFLPAYFKE